MLQMYIEGATWCPVKSLVPGQRVDLEGDPFADAEAIHPEFCFEFEVVAGLETETKDCIRVDFESGFSCGFPPEHMVNVDGEQ